MRWRSRAVASIRKRGLAGTVQLFPTLVAANFKGDPDKRFDRRFHVDTAGILKPIELQSDSTFKNSNWYAPSATHRFLRMLHHIKVDFRDYVFIDFGCGKGKALLLASRLPFRQIVGVELWSELFTVAEKNLKSYTGKRLCNTFRLHRMDATEFPIPSEPGIYYFFDPFREEVMRKVLDNMRRSLAAAPREAYVVYCEPERPDILDHSDFLSLLKKTPHYSIYRASGIQARQDGGTA
jgi:SAM-dependent methyltransferase